MFARLGLSRRCVCDILGVFFLLSIKLSHCSDYEHEPAYYFNIFDDKVLPCNQHLRGEYAVDTLFFKMLTAQFIGLEEYVTGFISTLTPYYMSIYLKNHLI